MDYKITISQQDIQTLFQGLGELPLKISINIFGKLQQQIQEQDKINAIPLESIKL